MSGPEDNPADDVQPTEEEWEEYDAQREPRWRKPSMLYEVCPRCDGKGCLPHSPGEKAKHCFGCKSIYVVETGATAGQLEYMAKLDTLRQESGISAAMLRDGRAKEMNSTIAALRHGCLAALGFLGGVSILDKDTLQKTLADAVKASGSEEKWSSA